MFRSALNCCSGTQLGGEQEESDQEVPDLWMITITT